MEDSEKFLTLENSFTVTPYQAFKERINCDDACVNMAAVLLDSYLIILNSQWEYDFIECSELIDVILLLRDKIIPDIRNYDSVIDKLFLIYEKNIPAHIQYFKEKFIEISTDISMLDRCSSIVQTWSDDLLSGKIGAKEEKIDRTKTHIELIAVIALIGKAREDLDRITKLIRIKTQYLGHHYRELSDPEGYPKHEIPEVFQHTEPEKFLSPD